MQLSALCSRQTCGTKNTQNARMPKQASPARAQKAHWHSLQSQSGEGSEVEAAAACTLQPQPYILSITEACSRGQQ